MIHEIRIGLGLYLNLFPFVELFCVILCHVVYGNCWWVLWCACVSIFFVLPFAFGVWCGVAISCTNNNYASREKCKKCGQPKEVAALSALAIPAASLQTHLHYLTRGPEPINQPGFLLSLFNPANQASVLKEWRIGDWICKCGFHNYSSHIQCKKCNEAAPLALGTKRLASEALAQEWDSKRLNQGYTSMQPHSAIYASFPGMSPGNISNWQLPLTFLQQLSIAALLGKGAKQWRDGDWMCTNCKNHNYASRSECNR